MLLRAVDPPAIGLHLQAVSVTKARGVASTRSKMQDRGALVVPKQLWLWRLLGGEMVVVGYIQSLLPPPHHQTDQGAAAAAEHQHDLPPPTSPLNNQHMCLQTVLVRKTAAVPQEVMKKLPLWPPRHLRHRELVLARGKEGHEEVHLLMTMSNHNHNSNHHNNNHKSTRRQRNHRVDAQALVQHLPQLKQ